MTNDESNAKPPRSKFDPNGIAAWRINPRTLEEQIQHLQGGLDLFRALDGNVSNFDLNGLIYDCIETMEHLEALSAEREEGGAQ